MPVPPPGVTSSTEWELTTAQLGKRPVGGCKKTADLQNVTAFPIPLTNDTDADVLVTIWHTNAGPAIDTAIYTYNTLPSSDTDFRACKTEPQDGCNITPSSLCDASNLFAGVSGIKVAAHSTIIVYSAGWYSTTKGKFVLNIKQDTP